MFNRRRITAALIGLIVLVLGGWLIRTVATGDESAPGPGNSGNSVVAGADSGLPVQALSALPPEAAATWKLIGSGGPFPYPRNDGVVFGNREKLLPQKGSGYYHEYTVPTKGSRDRGAQRLVTGGSSELFYTGDHYRSFVVVDPAR